MYICVCNAITDKQIRRAAKAGVGNLSQLQAALGVATSCGACGDSATEILREVNHSAVPAEPVLYVPAPA